MPFLQETKIFNHPPKKIYDLVMDIEKYPEFLPWCKGAKIIEVKSQNKLSADLLISFKGFLEKYRSLVVHEKISENVYSIEVKAIDGPFKKLNTKWKFKAIENENNCEVNFFIDFEFNSFLLNKMIGAIFEKASQKMVNAFEERAEFLLRENKNY
jgi:coenzyme Q-binding protein COQ10